jgi:nitrogen fixation protein NifU and related proteins
LEGKSGKANEREGLIATLVEHAKHPRNKGVLADADVAVPGGSPECGGSVVVYLKGEGERITGLSFTGQGDTISMGASSIAFERVLGEGLGMRQVLDFDYDAFVEELGRDVIGSRTRNATLGLSTLKAAIRVYQREDHSRSRERTVV